jgi:hypothetical protein
MPALDDVVCLFSDFTTACCIMIVVFDLVTGTTPSAFDMIKVAHLGAVVSLPTFLTLQHKLPRLHIFYFDKLTTNMIHFVDKVPQVDTVLRIPYIHKDNSHVIQSFRPDNS